MCAILSTTTLAHSGTIPFVKIFDPDFWTSHADFTEPSDVHWSFDSLNHTKSNTLTYKFDPSSYPYRGYFYQGTTLWMNETNANIEETSNGVGTVSTYSDTLEPGTAMKFTPHGRVNGHLTSWTIAFNTNYNGNFTGTIAAHEIGHAYGLYDLTNIANKNVLMYAYNSRTANGPTSNDIKGYLYATGQHTDNNHFWIYSNGRRKCNVCDGYKTVDRSKYTTWTDYSAIYHVTVESTTGFYVYEYHYPYYTTSCSVCGRTGPIIIP